MLHTDTGKNGRFPNWQQLFLGPLGLNTQYSPLVVRIRNNKHGSSIRWALKSAGMIKKTISSLH